MEGGNGVARTMVSTRDDVAHCTDGLHLSTRLVGDGRGCVCRGYTSGRSAAEGLADEKYHIKDGGGFHQAFVI